ncbi:Global transcription regulator sge1 [Tolypocladium capitatum]|uniref:Global transcription regulator sge1 n=1 Tax=Tolypocladium capitatum TaxID=45235 RepID=A0A2K3Q7P0_9HYPO|nr:Global transcription regulator sge1 [Tolypocladium capitatum]
MSNQSSPLTPSWNGYVASTLDALVLMQGTFDGVITHVPRRPHDRERQDLIKSGSIFIYEEHASGIKRWTDGVSWSPSRILGNFLIYRELDKPFAPGEKKRALKKKRSSPAGGISKNDGASRSSSMVGNYVSCGLEMGKETERSLIGSLTDSYEFKHSGLVKKTISITHRGVPHHLVSYYSVDDVISGRLVTPSKDAKLRNVVPQIELMTAQNFRSPIDELEYGPNGSSTLLSTLAGTSQDHLGGTPGNLFHRVWSNAGGIQTASPMEAAYAAPQYQLDAHPTYFSSMNSSISAPMASMPPPLPSSSSMSSTMTMSSMPSTMPMSMSSTIAPSMQSSMPHSVPSPIAPSLPLTMAPAAVPYGQQNGSYAWMPELGPSDAYWEDRATTRGVYQWMGRE